MAGHAFKIFIIINVVAAIFVSGCTYNPDNLKDETETISDGGEQGQMQNTGNNPSGTISAPAQTGQKKDTSTASGPNANIVAVNDIETTVSDVKITHMGGDALKRGEWKISIVPVGNSSAFINSPQGSDFYIGQTMSLFFTTEYINSSSEGNPPMIFLEPGVSYKVELVSIPTNKFLLNQIITVTGEPDYKGIADVQITAPTAGVLAANNPDTPDADVKITHLGGDTLKGGEWKLSIVPLGASPVYITSGQGSDLRISDIVIASTTTEGATGLSDSALTGGGQLLATGSKYDIKMVHIPTNAMMVDIVVEVR